MGGGGNTKKEKLSIALRMKSVPYTYLVNFIEKYGGKFQG
jgi:hypothetical protein